MAEETQDVTRRGRPWGPIRGESPEVRALAMELRSWVDKAGLSISELAQRLPHGRATIARRLAGTNLASDWDFVVDLLRATTVPESELRARRRAGARQLWERAAHSATLTRLPAEQDPPIAIATRLPAEQDPPSEGQFSSGGGVVISGTVHGGINITAPEPGEALATVQQQLIAAQERVIALMDELIAVQQRNRELADQLSRSHAMIESLLRSVNEQVEEEPSAERLRAGIARTLDALPSPREQS
ncbi:hypothetical protein ACFV4F_18310 [Kitasatospora sp. NPDC059722]|uniref:hypothetical protein n=1 Tax=Kitasatospora sp. NPDC059722 TaxID=3346925 RepID=UPI0036A8843D